MKEIHKQLLDAGTEGDINKIKTLLNEDTNIHIYNNKLLRNTVKAGHLDVVKFLLEKGANISVEKGECLISAIENNDLTMVRFLVEKGINIHSQDNLALVKACELGLNDIVKFLLEKKANIKASDYAPLKKAILKKHLEIIKQLTRDKIEDLDKVFINTIIAGDMSIIKYFISLGASVFAREGQALREAVRENNPEVVSFILNEQKYDDKYVINSVLEFAAKKSYIEVMVELLKADADINTVLNYGTSIAKEWAKKWIGRKELTEKLDDELEKKSVIKKIKI